MKKGGPESMSYFFYIDNLKNKTSFFKSNNWNYTRKIASYGGNITEAISNYTMFG